MRPLIPKVRPGDILKGTRNLRRYLRTAAQFTRASDIRFGHGRSTVQPYTPSKNDEFLVIVNAWNTFGVTCQEKEIVLLFQNPHKVSGPTPFTLRTFMDPSIFPNWFIRTGKKMPRVSQWPNYAVYIWAGLHLNLAGRDGYEVSLLHAGNSRGPFSLASSNARSISTRDLFQLVHFFSVRGGHRGKTPEYIGSLSGYGPRMEDIPHMEKDTKEICSNPRVQSLLEKEGF